MALATHDRERGAKAPDERVSGSRVGVGAIRRRSPSRRTSVWNKTALKWAMKVKKRRYAKIVCDVRSTV